MASTSKIVPTAPLHGIDLTAPNPPLPHLSPAPVIPLDSAQELSMEPGAALQVAGWRNTADYALPPLLDPSRPEMVAERDRLAGVAGTVLQRLQSVAAGERALDRGFQRKTLYATTTGELRVASDLPAMLTTGPFQPGAKWRAIVRFSNASSLLQSDTVPDQRAVGVRITDEQGRVQDLTFTSGAAGNHARGARQFLSTMRAAAHLARGGLRGRIRGALGLLLREGFGEMHRLSRARREAVDSGVSLAALSYYSRSPFEMAGKLVHLALLPAPGTTTALVHDARGARDGLGRDLCMRRTAGTVRFRLAVAEAPGLEDMSVAPAGAWVTIAELLLPRQLTSEAAMLRVAARVHRDLAMHPFNVWEPGVLTARGELNEILRKPVYLTSARNSGRTDAPPAVPQLGL